MFPTELKRILEDELKFASADKLIAEWKEQGNIPITDKGRTTHKIRIGKETYNVIHFRAGIIATDTDSAEINYYEKEGKLNCGNMGTLKVEKLFFSAPAVSTLLVMFTSAFHFVKREVD